MSHSTSQNCPQCGAALSPGAPGGLCPRCLMALNLKTETVFTDDTPAAQPPLPPEQIAPHFPQLEILACLGRGGMGVVYKARQKTLNRFVALKLLAPERVGDAQFAERFAREAQALAALNHPNIVTIHDFGQAGGFYFLLMEFVDGVNLRQLLRTRKFTPEEALAIVPPLCDALQFAHEHGIVHRDIKPENLLLDKTGRVKVADFGIAKMLGNGGGDSTGGVSAPDNATKTAMGTPGYSAPEQKTDPQRVDSRADIYSLGVVFYEMLTGELPGKQIEPPSRKVQIDVRLDQVVLRALEKTPELRFQQASEVKTCVERIAATPPESERREAESTERTGQLPPFSGAARLGAWLVVPFLLSMFFWDFGHKGGTDALVGCIMASLGIIAILGTTLLGWVALGQIRRANGRLRGLHLAMFEGLFLPVLSVDILIVFFLLLANKLVNVCLLSDWSPVPRDSAFINLPHYILWLLVTAVVVIGIDYAIIGRVWRRARRPWVAPPASARRPDHFWRWFAVSLVALALTPILMVIAAIALAMILPAVEAARHKHPSPPASAPSDPSGFAIGQASFPLGDFLEITSVYRTQDQMVVKGHYHLASQDQALLALFLTTTNAGSRPVESSQQMPITKGWGDFSLTHNHVVPGLPHVAMYAHGNAFANLYFGNPVEVAAERKLDLHTAAGITHRLERLLPTAGPWTNWNSRPEIGGFYAVAATTNETVAVGIHGLVATRAAATGVWRTQTLADGHDFRGLACAHGQYIAVSEGGRLLTSPDGLTWTTRDSTVTNNLLGVFWDGQQYLVGGDLGTLLTSPDGINWSRRTSGTQIHLSAFSYSGTRYVAVGNDGIILSDDTITWRRPANWVDVARVPFTACTWTGSEFLACGLGLDSLPTIYTSPDGMTWTLREGTITASLRTAITVNGAIYVAGDNMVAESTDGGSTWTNLFPATPGNQLFMSLATDGRFLIAAGFSPNIWVLPVPTSGLAAYDAWSPTLAPGEKPDLAAIRNDIKIQMDTTNYAAALQRQLWYFNHAREYGESDPVRLSFGIMNWAELGQKCPAARQALVSLSDRDMLAFSNALANPPALDARVLAGSTPGSKRSLLDLFQEISALHRSLEDNDGDTALVRLITAKDPEMARDLGYKVTVQQPHDP